MPIYEYECLKCSFKFEEIVLSTNSDVKCPKCNEKEVRKLLSTFAFKSSGSFSFSSSVCPTSCSPTSCSTCGK